MTDTSLAGAVPLLHEDGIAFRDRNRNGRLDPFEDRRLPVEDRVSDLLGRMTVEEKAGLMFHQGVGVGPEGELVEAGRAVRERDDVGTRRATGS